MEKIARLLIVDDEANARSALAELLREEGYIVETAADGLKALAKLAEFAPDLVVTDLKMPGLDGLGLLRKALEDQAEPAVVLMTAFGDRETAAEAVRAGAADFLTKPIDIDELSLVVARTLEQRRLRQAVSDQPDSEPAAGREQCVVRPHGPEAAGGGCHAARGSSRRF